MSERNYELLMMFDQLDAVDEFFGINHISHRHEIIRTSLMYICQINNDFELHGGMRRRFQLNRLEDYQVLARAKGFSVEMKIRPSSIFHERRNFSIVMIFRCGDRFDISELSNEYIHKYGRSYRIDRMDELPEDFRKSIDDKRCHVHDMLLNDVMHIVVDGEDASWNHPSRDEARLLKMRLM